MLASRQRNRGMLVLLGLLVGAGGSAAQSGSAQQASDNGYAVSESGEVRVPDTVSPAGTQENLGPVRLARFSYVQGNVTWRTDENTDWSSATLNMPLRQGAQIWVSNGGRAEIQFDDGSLLRLGTGAIVTLQTLYSDADGEFTELNMTEGLASLRLRHDRGVYQVNTPLGSLKAAGPASLRFGVGDGLEVAVKSGKATLEGAQGKADLQGGDFLDLRDSRSDYRVRDLPRADSWDLWNQDRDAMLARAESQPAQEHLPSDIAIMAGDLDSYGSWRNDSEDGWVWCPRVTSSDWRPYNDGHWTWVNPFGWTWVSNEAWGWAPYHYGTWVSRSYGWAWCPGPVHQYWSPAVVHFSECDGRIAWCPLAPREVRYPTTISIGFRRGNWSTYFAIGGAAVYYPTEYGYCAPRLYDTRYVNRVTYVTNVTNVTNVYNNGNVRNPTFNRFAMSQEAYAANNNTYLNGGRPFIPLNSRNAAGVTAVSSGDFAGRSAYVSIAKADTSLFARGRVVAAPQQGKAPVAGPVVKPTPLAMTPTRNFINAPQAVNPARQVQPVFRAPVQAAIVQNSAPITPSGKVLPPAPNQFNKTTMGPRTSGGINRNDRTGTPDRTLNAPTGNTGAFGQNQNRTQVQPRSIDGGQSTDKSNGGTPRPGYNQDRQRTTGDPRGGNAASDAANAARNSLGIPPRQRSNGGATDGTGSGYTPRSNGGSTDNTNNGGSGFRPRSNGGSTDGTNGNSNGYRSRTDSGSGNNGGNSGGSRSNGGYTGNPNGSNGNGNTDRAPRYSGGNGGGSNDSSNGKSAPIYTPRPTQQNPPSQPTRTEPTRTDPPRQAPTRTEPTRTEPTRSDPPRQAPPVRVEPTRQEPPRQEPTRQSPPPREDKSPPVNKGNDSGKDNNSKDSNPTNRGRGRG